MPLRASLSMGEISQKTRDMLSQMSGPNSLQQFANIWNSLYAQRQELPSTPKSRSSCSKAWTNSQASERSWPSALTWSAPASSIAWFSLRTKSKRSGWKERAAKQAAEERRKAAVAEAEAQAKADASRIKAGEAKEQVLVIDWKAPSKEIVAGATAAEQQQAERIANMVAPLVLRRVQQSRSVSVRGGADDAHHSGAIDLPADLQWSDEFTAWRVGQQARTSLTGALIVQESARQAGRPIIENDPRRDCVRRGGVSAHSSGPAGERERGARSAHRSHHARAQRRRASVSGALAPNRWSSD